MHPSPLTLKDVLADAPAIHGQAADGDLLTHGLIEEALEFIERTVRPGDRTLETGSGYSTLTFALVGAEHICITPNGFEVERLEAYLRSHGVSLNRLTFHVAGSQAVLPRLDLGPLDLVLIDGSHSFPHVFIDWYYAAGPLKVGGHLIVDDVHVWTGRVLRDFLRAEAGWELVEELSGRTAIFRKTASFDSDALWNTQPYVMRRSGGGVQAQGRMAVSMLRNGQRRELTRLLRTKLGR